MASVGIINGLVDLGTQAEYFPIFAQNNTYSIKTLPDDVAASAAYNYTKASGCRDLSNECNRLGAIHDPDTYGNSAAVVQACVEALKVCWYDVYVA